MVPVRFFSRRGTAGGGPAEPFRFVASEAEFFLCCPAGDREMVEEDLRLTPLELEAGGVREGGGVASGTTICASQTGQVMISPAEEISVSRV